jgi:hypothetical protein
MQNVQSSLQNATYHSERRITSEGWDLHTTLSDEYEEKKETQDICSENFCGPWFVVNDNFGKSNFPAGECNSMPGWNEEARDVSTCYLRMEPAATQTAINAARTEPVRIPISHYISILWWRLCRE